MENRILEFDHVKKGYYVKNRGDRKRQLIQAVNDISFSVAKGSTMAVVGESGSGKTTLAKLIMKFEEPDSGEIRFHSKAITRLGGKAEIKAYRSQVQMVHQDPASSLNPSKTIGQIIEEPLIVHRCGTAAQRKQRMAELLELVELPADFLNRYPHMLSGGQKQRVGIARAIALRSELIVLDEPTSALDVSVQEKIIALLRKLQASLKLTYLFITHDLALVKNFADDVVVLQRGNLVESGAVADVFGAPKEPYTKKLIKSIPVISREEEDYLNRILL